MTTLLALAALGVGSLLWWTSSRAHELATSHAARLCSSAQVQFLDQTVALAKMRLSRCSNGAVCLKRTYRFEYTVIGDLREQGLVVMNGYRLVSSTLPAADRAILNTLDAQDTSQDSPPRLH